MDTLQMLVIVLTIVAIVLLAYLVFQLRSHGSRQVLGRLRQLQETPGAAAAPEVAAEPTDRDLLPTIRMAIEKAGFTQRLLDDIARAGWRVKPSEFVGISLASMGAAMIVVTLLTQNIFAALLGGVIGLFLPRALLKTAMARRKAALESQISDMVMLVSSALRSGYSFLRALQVVAREMRPPISEACKRVVDETQLGVPMEDALTRMAAKVGSYDMDLVATAVIIQSQVGGSLAEVLDAIGETIRERYQIQGEVAALTAEGRISGIVLLLLTPFMAIALAVINPGYMSVLLSDALGIRMIVGAVMLQMLGFLIIRRMMKLDI
jgi:tight adherence protein B